MSTNRDTSRPLTARSVLASTLLGVSPPRLSTSVLVRSGELFGISPTATRTALSRMSAVGEVVGDGNGYRLAGHLADRRMRQDRSRLGATSEWDGTWMMAVVGEGRRSAADRAEFRAAAQRARLAELREGVWCRPDNLGAMADLGGSLGQCRRFLGARLAGDDAGARRLATELWDLTSWSDGARALIDQLEHLRPLLADEQLDVLPEAFVVSAATLRHLGADPLLPTEVLDVGWPGAELRSALLAFDAAFARAWRRWHRREIVPH